MCGRLAGGRLLGEVEEDPAQVDVEAVADGSLGPVVQSSPGNQLTVAGAPFGAFVEQPRDREVDGDTHLAVGVRVLRRDALALGARGVTGRVEKRGELRALVPRGRRVIDSCHRAKRPRSPRPISRHLSRRHLLLPPAPCPASSSGDDATPGRPA
jgi:hypothetical protein